MGFYGLKNKMNITMNVNPRQYNLLFQQIINQ
jgi:hypothetical protein